MNNPKKVLNKVTITESNLPTGIIYKQKDVIDNINFWHKFLILNPGKYKRNAVLGAIIDHVHPLDLIPVSYGKDHGTAHFLARNCGAAISKLGKDNLTVPNPDNPSQPFKLNIILKFATTTEFKVDVQKNIVSVLLKRYNSITKTLDLSNFSEDRGLSEFCPLSQPKILFFVLHLSKNLSPFPERFILSHNRIKLLNPLDALYGAKGITYIDLSNNLIEKFENLAPLKTLEITELVLDKNPICDIYSNEYEYVKQIKQHCQKLSVLDGISVKENFPITKNNFLCSSEGYDVVDQFLEFYFTLYDFGNRMLLEELYHKKAMFSLTSQYITGQMSSSTAQLRTYNMCSRNLLKLADFSRNAEYLFRGNLSILKVLTRLPASEHDPFSFKVDLMYSTPKCVIFNVSGVFRELPQNLLDAERYCGFFRTFALEKQSDKQEWCITNDQLHIYNALNFQITTSFKIPKPNTEVIPTPQSAKDQQQMADALKIITNLNTDWSKKCLEECNYDLKRALGLFIELYKVDKIPPEGFLRKF